MTFESRLRQALRLWAIVLAIVIGVLLVLLATAIGDCSAFGGRCPAQAPSWWEDDVFGTAAFGAALATGVPTFLARPSRRRLWQALAVATTAALVVGLIARQVVLS